MQDVYVFDMGGVIKESFDLKKFYLNIVAKVEFEKFKKYWDENVIEAEMGDKTSVEFLNKILQYSSSSKTIEEAEEIYGQCTGKLYKDAMNIIDSIKEKGKKVYLLSNLKEIDFKYLKQKLDINIFEKVFLSYQLGCMKNDTKIFQIVIDELKTNPNHIYFFDDKEENINNAKKMGINAHKVDGNTIKHKWMELQKNGIISV